jgi:hypothetical protein
MVESNEYLMGSCPWDTSGEAVAGTSSEGDWGRSPPFREVLPNPGPEAPLGGSKTGLVLGLYIGLRAHGNISDGGGGGALYSAAW